MCIVVFLSLLDAATAEIYTLSLHDALPISELVAVQRHVDPGADVVAQRDRAQQVRAPAPLALGHRQRRRHDGAAGMADRKSTRLNSSHLGISYAVFCLKKKKGSIK